MIDWWGLFHNSLWIAGLAVDLGTLSMARFEAKRTQVRLRYKLLEPSFQIWFCVGIALFCSGMAISGRAWWEHLVWGLLALTFAGRAAWLWWRCRTGK
ncbi:hypothetical protein ACFLT5_00270 [Chloroflexota bacterium]